MSFEDRAALPPINFAALNEALLARIEQLVPSWLPGGSRAGVEYRCGSVDGGAGTSMSVNVAGTVALGRWSDFASGEKGNDLVGLYAAINGLSMGKAALQVAREEGLEDVAGVQHAAAGAVPVAKPVRVVPVAVPRTTEEGWVAVVPVPDHAPVATFHHHARKVEDIEHTAPYWIDGALMGYVVRFRTSDGGKETLPYTWCTSAKDGNSRWHWKGWDEPRPLYFPGRVSPLSLLIAAAPDSFLPTVILVEGEKKAGVLQDLLTAFAPGVYLVASWPGGCKAYKKADWHWLAGSTVLLWPDVDAKRVALTKAERDAAGDEVGRELAAMAKPLLAAHKQPGMAAMRGIGALLAASFGCTVSVLPVPEPGEVADGWDCGDAIAAGWTGERVFQLFGGASALVSGEGEVVVIDEKKSSVSLPLGEDGFEWIKGKKIPDWLVHFYNPTKRIWYATRELVILVLERDPLLAPVLSYNELSNNVQSRTLWPWAHAQIGDVTDAVDLMLGKYLTDTYGLPSIPRAALMEAIQTVAHMKRFHPIREELEGLVWDGKPRLDKWLTHVLGESPDTLTPAMLEYYQIVGRCWILGMVNRVMEPGCKFDYCPVLEGVGGLRKSTMVEILGGSKYYSDTPFEVGRGKEAQEQVQGLWVYEIAEMTHFSKADIGAIKAFISSKVDRYRVAYGSTVGSFARQCILVGTTNENTYLRDRTGNRRFWPIPVRHVINTEWLVRNRAQLLAEAFALYKTKVAFTPSVDAEKRLFAPMQESRLVETAVVSELLYVLTRDPHATGIQAVVNNLADFVTIAQLALALGVDAAKSTPALEAQIRGWLDHEGWARQKKMINSVRAWGYVRPLKWPTTDDDVDMTVLPAGAVVVAAGVPGDNDEF